MAKSPPIVSDNQSFIEVTTTTISNLIEKQFPAYYQENAPMLIAFIQSYYQWLEQTGNPLFYARRYFDIKDIDKTLDQFLVNFKQKYLNNIQLDTSVDTRMLIKHALDIYRSKGTQQEIQLLFQLVYKSPISIYLPGSDLFKLSDGVWSIPKYLELELNDNNVKLEGLDVVGLLSQSVAFVDRVIRTTIQGRLIDVAFISAFSKDFQTYEKIVPVNNSLSIEQCPIIIGSLTDVVITATSGTGQNYNVGDIVQISSATGSQALARVSNTTNSFGIVDVQMSDGGYGYSSNAAIYIANSMITMSNVVPTANQYYLKFGDVVRQHLAFIDFNAATGLLLVEQNVFSYFANGMLDGTGILTFVNQTSNTSGNVVINISTGSFVNTFYTTSNAVSANISSYTDITATGKYLGMDTMTIYSTKSNNFQVGETIINPQVVGTSAVILSTNNTSIVVNSISGTWQPAQQIIGMGSNTLATVDHVDIVVGLSNVTGQFISTNSNIITTDNLNPSTILNIFTGNQIEMYPGSLTYTENVMIGTGQISDYLNKGSSIGSNGFFANTTTANLTNCTIGSCFTFANATIGKISQVFVTDFGQNYNHIPVIRIVQPEIYQYHKKDYEMTFSGSTGNFNVGEMVTQAATGAIGLVSQQQGTNLFAQNIKFSNDFIVTTNSSTQIVGSQSGSVANVVVASYNQNKDPFNDMGINAVFDSNFSVGNGSITAVQITDSGYGFQDHQAVTFSPFTGQGSGGKGASSISKQGKHVGYYKSVGGFLSSNKKLFDGNYYQNYSYEIISSVIFDKYQAMIQQLAHPAGTKLFGRFKHVGQTTDSKQIEFGSLRIGSVTILDIPGYDYLIGADGAYLLGTDGAYLLGVAS